MRRSIYCREFHSVNIQFLSIINRIVGSKLITPPKIIYDMRSRAVHCCTVSRDIPVQEMGSASRFI